MGARFSNEFSSVDGVILCSIHRVRYNQGEIELPSADAKHPICPGVNMELEYLTECYDQLLKEISTTAPSRRSGRVATQSELQDKTEGKKSVATTKKTRKRRGRPPRRPRDS